MIASQVKQTIDAKCPGTFSLYAGYGFNEGNTVRFPTGVPLSERRNEQGRCIHAEYQYADDSKLVFKYSPMRGYSLTVKSTK